MTAEACVPSKVLGLHLDVLGLQHELCVLYQDVLGLQHELCVLYHLQWEGVYRERNQIYLFQSTCYIVVPSYYLSKTRSQSQSTRCIYTHTRVNKKSGSEVRLVPPPKTFLAACHTDPLPTHHSFMALPGTRVLFPRLPFPNVIKTLARYISP
jgi:hypothetical protein